MTDIIANAQKLLDGATPGPWELSETEVTHRLLGGEVYEYGGEPVLVVGGGADDVSSSGWGDEPPYCYDIHRAADSELMAAAPEHAQALAEETYQYGVTYTGLNHGGQHIQWVESTGDTEWDKETLQLLIKRWKKQGQSPKIVRRRVSPREVIND